MTMRADFPAGAPIYVVDQVGATFVTATPEDQARVAAEEAQRGAVDLKTFTCVAPMDMNADEAADYACEHGPDTIDEEARALSLSDRAAQAAKASSERAAARKQDEVGAEGSFVTDRVADLLGVPTTYLDSFEGTHPIENRDRYGGVSVTRAHHTVHRLLADDVTLWWLMPSKGSSDPRCGDIVLERPCRGCGRPHFVAIRGMQGYDALLTSNGEDRYAGGGHEEYRRKRYLSTRSDKARAEYVLGIGQALRREPLCWDCKIGVPYACPTCGRPNEADGRALGAPTSGGGAT